MRHGFSQRQLMRHNIRLTKVCDILKEQKVSSVLDLGCGDGQLIEMLAKDHGIARLTGVDVDKDSLTTAKNYTKKYVADHSHLKLLFTKKQSLI